MTGLGEDGKWAALDWLGRLPLLGAFELSMLLGVGEREAATLPSELRRCGWLESMSVESPELEPGRAYTLSRQGVLGLATALGLSVDALESAFPVGEAELSHRRGRIEITVGVNRFLAELVAAARSAEGLELDDLRASPSRRRSSAWWPTDVEAFGCLRATSAFAPFFVAWDRAGAPSFHRAKRVASWYGFREDDQPWGYDGMPSILVLCPSQIESSAWERAVLAAADRRGGRQLPVLLAEIDAVFSAEPLEALWRRPGGMLELPLTERLAWRWTMPEEAENPRFVSRLPPLEPPPNSVGTNGSNRRIPPHQAASLGTVGATEMRLIEWLGHHPLLTAGELAVLVRMRDLHAPRLLAALVEKGLIDSVQQPLSGEPSAAPRFFLTVEGLKLLAARDGVPPRRYLRHGAIAAAVPDWKGGGRFGTLLRQYEHTVGANGFSVRLISEVLRCGGQVVRWLSASESSERFTHDGVTHWLRPDAAIDLTWQGTTKRLYLEWDRGTMRLVELGEKLRTYAICLSPAGAESHRRSQLLIVTTTPQRERMIQQAFQSAVEAAGNTEASVLTSVASLMDRLGPVGRIWDDGSGVRQPLRDAQD